MLSTLLYRSRVIIRAIAPFIDERTRVLDIGCGNAVVSSEIMRHFGCRLIGTDVQKYLSRNIEFRKMPSYNKLDFNNNEFDLGLFNDVLHHIPGGLQMVLIKEALRVCSRVLVFEVEPSLLAKLAEYPLNWINNRNVPIPLSHRAKEEWLELFQENHIRSNFYPVARPSLWYPFVNYLFYLEYSRGIAG